MSGDDVSLGEIARRLDGLTDEFRLLRQELVRRDVYEAERRADQEALAALKARVDNQESTKRQAQLAMGVAVLGFVLSLVLKLLWPESA